MNPKFEMKEFYVQLGKLAYAVALADGRVQKAEIKDLHKQVRDVLLRVEQSTDEFDTNLAFYTEFEFETRLELQTSVDEVYQSFISYLKENNNQITPRMKEIIFSTVRNIAEAYGGIVDREQELLNKLEIDLKML